MSLKVENPFGVEIEVSDDRKSYTIFDPEYKIIPRDEDLSEHMPPEAANWAFRKSFKVRCWLIAEGHVIVRGSL